MSFRLLFCGMLACLMIGRLSAATLTETAAGGVFQRSNGTEITLQPVPHRDSEPSGWTEPGPNIFSTWTSGGTVWIGEHTVINYPPGSGTYRWVQVWSEPLPGVVYLRPPEEEPVDIQPDFDRFEDMDYDIFYDTDGDGNPETKIGEGTVTQGGTTDFTPPGPNAWEVRAKGGHVDIGDGSPVYVPYTGVIGGGNGGGGAVAPTIIYDQGGDMVQSVVDADGNQTTTTVQVGNVTTGTGAPARVYTYNNSDGGRTSIIYKDTGVETAKSEDVRLASAKNSSENEALLKELKKQTALLNEIADQGDGESGAPTDPGTASAEGRPAASGETNENEAKGGEIGAKAGEAFTAANEMLNGLKEGSWRRPMPLVSSGYGSSLSWTADLPVLGAVHVNLNPYSNIINAWRNFVKFLLALVCWAVSIKIVRGSMV